MKPGTRDHLRNDPADIRAFTRAEGIFRRPISCSRFGQISDSIHSAMSGRQWSRNRRTQGILSTGT